MVLHISVNNSRFYGCELVKLALPRCPEHNAGTVCTETWATLFTITLSLSSSWCAPSIPYKGL